jgi:hypothetical protein
MADFTTFVMNANTGSQASPTWTSIYGANHECRWSDISTQDNVASASWVPTLRPAATQAISYTYAFTADATGTGFVGTAGPPVAFARGNYNFAQWSWDNLGTFASAPIFTAFPTTAHGAITRGDGSLLGGSADTLNVTNFSYLKGNGYGQVGVAGAGPGADPAVTNGTVGSMAPAAGANWLANFQDLCGTTDYITFPATPAATTAGVWAVEFELFTGPNMTPALYQIVMTLQYTWT